MKNYFKMGNLKMKSLLLASAILAISTAATASISDGEPSMIKGNTTIYQGTASEVYDMLGENYQKNITSKLDELLKKDMSTRYEPSPIAMSDTEVLQFFLGSKNDKLYTDTEEFCVPFILTYIQLDYAHRNAPTNVFVGESGVCVSKDKKFRTMSQSELNAAILLKQQSKEKPKMLGSK